MPGKEENIMLELVTLPPAFGMRNVSPFCLKAELLLTALEIPFEHTELADPRKAPKGKLPYLVADGNVVADSELIVEYLDGMTQGRVYAGLTPARKAHGFALTRLAEDHLYWIMVAGIYDNQPPTWLTEMARNYERLHAYTERVQAHMGAFGREPQ
jgi:glutathione S-transferase